MHELLPRRRSTPCLRSIFAALVAGLGLFGLETPVSGQVKPSEPIEKLEALEGLEEYVETAMRSQQVPGVAIAVVKDDVVVYARGFGVRKLGNDAPVDQNTVFAIASNTKAFTCALLATLVDEGTLSWDDKVSGILPWFQLHDPAVTRDLTVLDLLTHRSGLPTFGGDHLWIGSSKDAREILTRIRHLEATAPFRYSYQYQNIMYAASGEIVPARTGKTWAELVRARILDPLGMKDTTTGIDGLKGRDNVATPHEIRGGELTIMSFDDVDAIAAAAALNSSVLDLSQWLRLLLAGGKWGDGRILSSRAMRDIGQSYVHMPVSEGYTRIFGSHFRSYGLGWVIKDYRGRKVLEHGGALTGMISHTTWVPEEKLGIVVLTNMAENSVTDAVTLRVLDRYLGAPDRDWNQIYLRLHAQRDARAELQETGLEAQRKKDTRPSLPLSEYTGDYHHPLPGKATVSLREGKLYFFYNRRHHGFLTHWHFDTFRIHWLDAIMDMDDKAFVRFVLDEKGTPVELHTKWYHPIEFTRVRAD